MDTEDTVVDDRSKGQVIEHGVDLIPQLPITSSSQTHLQCRIVWEPLLQLAEQATIPSVFAASLPVNKEAHNHIHKLHLVVSAKEKYLVWIARFLCKEIGQQLETERAVVHVVSQKQKDARGEVDAQRPQLAGKQSQIVHTSMKISEHVCGRLQAQYTRL